jgi:hypothetical protein
VDKTFSYFAVHDTNVDTGGEFPSAVVWPELGQDEARWKEKAPVLDVPDEFATSVNVGFGPI